MKPPLRYSAFTCILLALLLWAGCNTLRSGDFATSVRVKTKSIRKDAPVVYVAVGDSTGIGLGAKDGNGYVDLIAARIKQKRPGSRLINLSTAWATTADVLSKDLRRFPVEPATLVTISLGVNDLIQGVSDEQFASNFEEIVAGLEKTGALIIVTNLPDVSLAPGLSKSKHSELTKVTALFNKRIEEVARRHKLPLIDLYHISKAVVQSSPESFATDGLHPSDVGYALWAEAMWPTVENTINE
jgi:acyl-CoA thioesterase-1